MFQGFSFIANLFRTASVRLPVVMRQTMIACLSLVSILLTLSLATSMAKAAQVYVYEDQNGGRLITDKPSRKAGLKLIKKYAPRIAVEVLGPRHYQLSTRNLTPRTSEFDQTIFKIADSFKQDRALIKAIIQVESSFNPNAVSPKGAQGLMQLMPATANAYRVYNPFNAQENLRGGIEYFDHLMTRYDNNVRFALAAYNAGEGNVNKYNGIPPFPETQNYVKHVLRLHKSYQRYDNTYS